MPDSEAVIDPIELQREAMAGLATTELKMEELCNPTAVRLIIGQRLVNLAELEGLKREAADLRSENRQLIDSRDALRVDLARSEERDLVSWIEIPVSAVLGFSFTLALDEASWMLGVILLIMMVAILFFLRLSYLVALVRRALGKE